MIPEILVIVNSPTINSATNEILNNYKNSETLHFKAYDQINYYKYKLVSEVVYNGNGNSGHYYTNCLRKKKWYNLNDANFTPLSSPYLSNAYCIIYHYVDTVDSTDS